MAKSRFEYVRNYELPDPLMPNTFIVVRIDGRGFHKFSDTHSFEKPNDRRALDLMDMAAKSVMGEYKDVIMAFGESDEYSFLIKRSSKLYNRRRSKINSSIVSLFTSSYVFYWPHFFPNMPLQYPPCFDSRVVLYPGVTELRDYFSWRQADTHINNLYNTTFWALVHGGQSTAEANKTLQGTDSKDKNEILFSQYGINYNNIPEIYRKGSICVREPPSTHASTSKLPIRATIDDIPTSASSSTSSRIPTPNQQSESISINTNKSDEGTEIQSSVAATEVTDGPSRPHRTEKKPKKIKPYEGTEGEVVVIHEDIIGNKFWEARPWLLL
ncbi:hypothetical protein CI109_105257 [Kwoniella shandongensis]|uniref:tRNA(His) guanylyltransferase n=1 Tax=Kwoniella shandongensis TaxID=1734106 RepID=A0A5M6C3N6_9TREE|nr:uncharacterized protein CI109_002100 [Kwoniella shandongensis]KAA5529674.1 hypothetical protein CI109_002100 [Kwoniella shandongensis]